MCLHKKIPKFEVVWLFQKKKIANASKFAKFMKFKTCKNISTHNIVDLATLYSADFALVFPIISVAHEQERQLKRESPNGHQ